MYVGATSSGQGHETVFAQVCADELQILHDRIRVICASTDELEEGFGTWHSRSAVMSGMPFAPPLMPLLIGCGRSPPTISGGRTLRSIGRAGFFTAATPTHAWIWRLWRSSRLREERPST